MKRIYTRSQRGQATIELAGSLVWLLPMVVTLAYAVTEISQAYYIANMLSEGASAAARGIAVAYGQTPAIATSSSLQDSVFNNVRIPNVINNSSQFSNPVFNNATLPGTVTVTVSYVGGQYGLPQFPTFDPLKLGSGYQLHATSTYALE